MEPTKMHFKTMSLFFITFFLGVIRPTLAKDLAVDFEYRPPQWRTAICLPDDPYKTLVDEKGTLLYHYARKSGDFNTMVSVVVDEAPKPWASVCCRRACRSCEPSVKPRICESFEEVFAIKMGGSKGSPTVDKSDARNDVVLVHVANKGGAPQTIEPKVLVRSRMKIDFPTDSTIRVNRA